MSHPPADRVRVLGLPVDRVNLDELLDRVEEFVQAGKSRTVAYLNVHVANAAARDEGLRVFLDTADLCYCDGEGIRLGARILGHTLPPRMTGADWIWDLAARAEGRSRLFWLGGAPGVTEQASAVLRERHPGLVIGHDHGFHEEELVPALLDRINAFEPDVLLIGMGACLVTSTLFLPALLRMIEGPAPSGGSTPRA